MNRTLSLAALVVAGQLFVAAPAAAAAETAPLGATLELLGALIEAQTLVKMQAVVDRELARFASRVPDRPATPERRNGSSQ